MKCKQYPLNTEVPLLNPLRETRALVTEDQFCRSPSLWCLEDGPLHIDPLWRLFVIP